MKKYLISTIVCLAIWLVISLSYNVKYSNRHKDSFEVFVNLLQSYSDSIKYWVCVWRIAYWENRDYKRCEKISVEVIESLKFYNEKFPLFFKNID